MQHQSYFEHPAEEALERFLLRRSPEDELELVETHVLACESCIKRLETMELQIEALKIALKKEQETVKARDRKSWFSSFLFPTLSWAGAAAGIALCVSLSRPADVSLSAYRGIESTAAPQFRPLHFHLNATDVNGPVTVEVVNATNGAQVWKGNSTVANERANVDVPRIAHRGSYLLRLYTPGSSGNTGGELLREFAFTVK
jgi:hypothetical protein